MKLIKYSADCERLFESSVIALGLFDGVHIGHRALFERAKSEAKKLGVPFLIFTFFPESSSLKGGQRLYTGEEKTELLSSIGADFLIYADFSDIAEVSAESFVLEILVKKLGATLTVSGADFRFGKNRAGDTLLLSKLMRSAGGDCCIVEDVEVSGKKVSTTLIKELLAAGDMRLAGELLGDAYFISGEVLHGDGRGQALGSPTVNVTLPESKGFLRFGVYRSRVRIGEKVYTGLTNVGVCPTFGERTPHAETYILDFSGNVYGEKIKIQLVSFLRDEIHFSGKDELLKQIEKDVRKARMEECQENGIN